MGIERIPMYLMETGSLPNICSHRRCLNDPVAGYSFCAKHIRARGREEVGSSICVNMKPSFSPGKSVHISPKGWTWIYFVRQGEAGPIKIGRAANLKARVSSMETANPEPLNILFAFIGREQAEKDLHKVFSDIRIRGEWFTATNDLLDSLSIMRRGVYPSVIADKIFYKNGAHLTYWDL